MSGSILVEGKRLYVPGSQEPWPWWVGPDPVGHWHVALAPDKPNAESRTTEEAVCGLKPPTQWTDLIRGTWWSWKWQRHEPPGPRALCCPDCLMAAQQHDWPRPAGLVAFSQPSVARR